MKAIPYLESAIKLEPSNFEFLKNLAAIYLQLKKWDNAARVYGQIMAHYPDQVEIHPYYIQSLVNAGKADQAISELTAFLQRHADNKNAQRQLSILKNSKR